MKNKFYLHLRAFVFSHQIGEDPHKNLAKIKVIANTNPASWDGNLPTEGIKPDNGFCRVLEAARGRPVVPWGWYAKEREPVPAVVEDIYRRLSFDFSLVYPQQSAWIFVAAEPSPNSLELIGRQRQLKAFALVSLFNERLKPAERAHKRLRLSKAMESRDLERIHVFVAFDETDRRFRSLPGDVPAVSRLVHPGSNTATWNIRLPGSSRTYGSFQEIV